MACSTSRRSALSAPSRAWPIVATIGWRLIPQVSGATDPAAQLYELEEFVAELEVPEESDAVDKRVSALDGDAEKSDVAVIGLVRSGRRLYGAARNEVIRAGDALVVEAAPEAIEEFKNELGLEYEIEGAARDRSGDRGPDADGGRGAGGCAGRRALGRCRCSSCAAAA